MRVALDVTLVIHKKCKGIPEGRVVRHSSEEGVGESRLEDDDAELNGEPGCLTDVEDLSCIEGGITARIDGLGYKAIGLNPLHDV